MTFRSLASALILTILVPIAAFAQSAQVAFGGIDHDSSLPVEITANKLQIDQNAGTAVFTGDVIVGQGEMRMTSKKLDVFYDTSDSDTNGDITKMIATGDVVVVNGEEAAEAKNAVYTVVDAQIFMTGDVLLTQGRNALSSDEMTIHLDSGTATMNGRVRSILQSENKN